MTDKRKQRIRRRMAETGQSFQAVSNSRKPKRSKTCPSCDGANIDFSAHGVVLRGYDHKPGCKIGRMVRDGESTRCPRCGHLETIIRSPPYGISVCTECPKCLDIAEAPYEYVLTNFRCNVYGPLREAARETVNTMMRERLALLDGWKAEGANVSAYLSYYEETEEHALVPLDPEDIVRECRYDRLIDLVDRHARERPMVPPKSLSVIVATLVPRSTIKKLEANPLPIRR